MTSLGKLLIIFGGAIVILGVLLLVANKIPFLGSLPGDIKLEKGNYKFYFPITSCIVLSILLTLLLRMFRR